MARTDAHFRLRLPDDIRQRVRASAERNRRTMTGEIVFHLANALGDESRPATGEKFGDRTPAAGSNSAALPGGAITHG